MKPRKLILLPMVLVLLCSFASLGFTEQSQKGNPRLGKLATIDTDTYIDVNNIKMWVTNTGSFAWDVTTGHPGLIYPKGTDNTVVFASGLWMGAKVNNEIRIALSEYSDEYVPGVMKDSTFSPDEPRFRVYKINSGDGPGVADWDEWPIQDGAPFEVVDDDTIPKLFGDQTLWTVYNDADASAHKNNAGATAPLGVEVQITAFGFDRPGALGNCVFLKLKIINKGPNLLDSTFVALWSDPDLGGAMDDLVGCDTILSVGYCYNATNDDDLYGSAPPCVGYDFFQGPIVPGAPTDTAWVSGEPRPGFTNLPMTAFNKYINGTDPTSKVDTWNYLKGLDAVFGQGAPYVNPVTGDTTTFAMSGNPVTGTGWLDANPADRRFMMCAGPFTMATGDTQEVVGAIVVGEGKDRLTSITAMKFFDSFAQTAFDLNFELPEPPAKPVVQATALDREVVLTWEDHSELNSGDYPFEGYNVYQGASAVGPWKRIATYDLNNNVGIIFDNDFDIESGVVINKPVQFGSDIGIKRYISMTQDYWRGGSLHNGTPYYFDVTAYSYDPEQTPKTQENRQSAITVIPQTPVAGTEYHNIFSDTITVRHVGISGGQVVPLVTNPKELTGHDYVVTFGEDTLLGIVWNLIDVTDEDTLLKDQVNQSGDEDYQMIDGLLVKAVGPELAIAEWSYEPSGNRFLTGVDWGGRAFWGGMDIGAQFFGSNLQGADFVTVELRFSNTDRQYGFNYLRPGYAYQGFFEVPFTAWDVDAEPDRQINVAFVEWEESAVYDSLWMPDTDDVGGREYLFIMKSDYDATGTLYDDDNWAPEVDVLYAGWFKRKVDSEGNPRNFSEGDVFTIVPYYINTSEDTFYFSTKAPTVADVNLAKEELKKIRVVPNPYFNSSIYEPDQFNRVIKFTNLPEICTIRIFNLAGDLIRVLRKDDPASSILEWDVKTKHQLPVASGIYIYYVEAEGLGSTYGKMAIFTEKERLITY